LRDALDVEPEDLLSYGHQVCESIWKELNGYAPISPKSELTNLGIAHGWAGMIYATLCWSAASGHAIPPALPDRLEQLASFAVPQGRGLAWPWDLARQPNTMPGWCNGSAGHVFLWTQAHQALRDVRYLDLAEGAAWHAWEARTGPPSLCCGLGGQAYALLRLYRHSGDSIWLTRARELFTQAAAAAAQQHGQEPLSLDSRPESLYKGELGLAVLEADLEQPKFARMPLFEPMIGEELLRLRRGDWLSLWNH
jgi:serine/threonine-protein kinase